MVDILYRAIEVLSIQHTDLAYWQAFIFKSFAAWMLYILLDGSLTSGHSLVDFIHHDVFHDAFSSEREGILDAVVFKIFE